MKNIYYQVIAALFITIITTNITEAAPVKTSIIGKVIDKASGQPIEYANLVVYKVSDSSMAGGAVSSTNGDFSIQNLKFNSYYLKAHFIGYQAITISDIEINSKNKTVDLGRISMSPASVNLSETEIIGTNDYIDFKIDKTVVNVQEQLSAEGGAVVDALTNVPSVQVDGGGNVSLRGSTSFTLLIDGQPSVLDASDALNQIPSSEVDKIEIITNPSVKYDSDGTAGIINLVMKKQKSKGTSGQVTLMLATGDKLSGNILLNKRSKNIRSHIGVTYSNKRKRTESTDDREIFINDSIDYNAISSDRDIYRKNYKFNAGIGWSPDTNNTIAFDVEIGQWEFDRKINSKLWYHSNYSNDTNNFQMFDDFKVTNNYITGDLNYSHLFSKEEHKLDMALYYSKLTSETPNFIEQSQLNNIEEVINTTQLNTDNESDRNHLRFKTDYTLPISEKLKFETGYQFDLKTSYSQYNYDFSSNPFPIPTADTSFTDEMDFSRMVNSLYGILNTDFVGISVKAGLRIEFVNQMLTEVSIGNDHHYDDINLFPSLHLSKVLEGGKQLSLSYSRRVSRPNEWMLIPTATSTGRNMLQLGNPELLPDFTNSFEFGFSMRNDVLLLNSQLFTRYTKNAITSSVKEKYGRFFQSYENLDNELASGLEFMANINIRKWWRVNLSASGYYYSLKGTLDDGYNVDNNSFAWNGSFRTTFIVKHKTYLEFLAIYYGPSILPQGTSKDFYYFDFFVKRNFFNRSLTVALRSHNTFDSGIYIADTEGVNYKAHTWFNYEGPTFMITVTYRLNNFRRHRSSNNLDMNFDSGLDN